MSGTVLNTDDTRNKRDTIPTLMEQHFFFLISLIISTLSAFSSSYRCNIMGLLTLSNLYVLGLLLFLAFLKKVFSFLGWCFFSIIYLLGDIHSYFLLLFLMSWARVQPQYIIGIFVSGTMLTTWIQSLNTASTSGRKCTLLKDYRVWHQTNCSFITY